MSLWKNALNISQLIMMLDLGFFKKKLHFILIILNIFKIMNWCWISLNTSFCIYGDEMTSFIYSVNRMKYIAISEVNRNLLLVHVIAACMSAGTRNSFTLCLCSPSSSWSPVNLARIEEEGGRRVTLSEHFHSDSKQEFQASGDKSPLTFQEFGKYRYICP